VTVEDFLEPTLSVVVHVIQQNWRWRVSILQINNQVR